MRWSLTTSFLLHAGILAAAFVVLPNPEEFQVKPQDSIPVDIVSIEDFGKRQALSKTAEPPKPEEKVAPKKSDPVKEVKPEPEVAPEVKTAAKQPSAPEPKKEEPKPPEPKKAEAKPPEPKKVEPKPLDSDPLKDLIKTTDAEAELLAKIDEDQKKKAEEDKKAVEEEKKIEEKKKSEAKKKEEAKKAAKKKQKDLNLDEVADLLNKIDDTRSAPAKPSEETGSPKQADVNLQGTDDSLAATLADLLIKRFSECWTPPIGSREAQLSVKVRFELNKDGTVSGSPVVVNNSAEPLFSATAVSAVSAVQGCGPYDFLPADRFDLWREVTVNFNPNQMFRS